MARQTDAVARRRICCCLWSAACLGVLIAGRPGGMVANFMQALQCIHTRHFLFAALLTVPIWMSEAV
jgi:hypothetical protein